VPWGLTRQSYDNAVRSDVKNFSAALETSFDASDRRRQE
jgi:hypothetical protein